MRRILLLPLIALGACALQTRVRHADPEALANKRLGIAVLDVFDGSATQDPALVQMSLTQALFRADYLRAETTAQATRTVPWGLEAAAEVARKRGRNAALTVEIGLVGEAEERAGGDPGDGLYSTQGSGPGARRDYFVRDRDENRPTGPRIRAVARLVEARTARVIYEAEVEAPAGDLSESSLADALVAPLEDY